MFHNNRIKIIGRANILVSPEMLFFFGYEEYRQQTWIYVITSSKLLLRRYMYLEELAPVRSEL